MSNDFAPVPTTWNILMRAIVAEALTQHADVPEFKIGAALWLLLYEAILQNTYPPVTPEWYNVIRYSIPNVRQLLITQASVVWDNWNDREYPVTDGTGKRDTALITAQMTIVKEAAPDPITV